MKKILHILVLPKLTGCQKIAYEILSHLSEKEYDKYILFGKGSVLSDAAKCIEVFEKAGVNILFSSNLKREIGIHDLFAFFEIYRLCKYHKFDIVHTNSTKPGIIGRMAAFLSGTPLVVHTVHGVAFHKYEQPIKRFFYYLCEFIASFFCHKIILVNKFYKKYYRLWKNKVVSIYNAIDYSQLPSLKYNRCINDQNVNLLFVGRLDIQKDPITLLKAFDIIVNDVKKKCHLTIVGDGEYRDLCLSYIKQHNLESDVTMVGWVNDVSVYYSSHDIFCLSSIYESFGLVFLEAGYYELPSVATNVEGIPEVVEDGKTGYLVPPRNHQLLAEKLLILINSPQLRKQIGLAAKKKVITDFSIEKLIKSVEEIYHNK
jgi:glycosyltransferase involved in cell wall biosynthesis